MSSEESLLKSDAISDLICPICTELFVEPHVVCLNQHTLCADCIIDMLEHGDAKCPQCRASMSIERNRLACSAVSLIALSTLTDQQKADHLSRKAKLESEKPDLKGMLLSKQTSAGTDDLPSSSSSVTSESDSDSSSFTAPFRSAELGCSLAMLLSDTLDSADDQERLDASSQLQRRREAEVEQRLQSGQANHERDEASRWNRTSWGQQPGGFPKHAYKPEVRGEVHDRPPTVRVNGESLAALRGAVELSVLQDEAFEKQRRREAEIEDKLIARERDDVVRRQEEERRNDAAKWSRGNWSQAAGSASVRTATVPIGRQGAVKTVLCRYHAKGDCRFGSMCKFAHGAGELRTITGTVPVADSDVLKRFNAPRR